MNSREVIRHWSQHLLFLFQIPPHSSMGDMGYTQTIPALANQTVKLGGVSQRATWLDGSSACALSSYLPDSPKSVPVPQLPIQHLSILNSKIHLASLTFEAGSPTLKPQPCNPQINTSRNTSYPVTNYQATQGMDLEVPYSP